MSTRFDYFGGPPPQKVGMPTTTYPSPIQVDRVVTIDTQLNQGGYHALPYGTTLPGDTGMALVWQGIMVNSTNQKWVRRIYSNGRAAQDCYNASYKYNQGYGATRIHIRRSLELREDYQNNTVVLGGSLTSLIGLTLFSGGTNYPSAVTVTFTGGGGSGAAATAEVQNGVIVALRLTNCGTGYTSVPTVGFTAASGSGAGAAARIQSAGEIQIDEEAEAADGEMGSLYVMVTRTFMDLPGPALVRYTVDEETSAPVSITSQLVTTPTGAYTQTPGTRIEFIPINKVYGTKITTQINGGTPPDNRTELRAFEFSFPALLFGISGTPVPDQKAVITNSNRRAAFTRLAQGKVTYKYGTYADLVADFESVMGTGTSFGTDFPTVFVPRTADLEYNGYTFSVHERNVLNDEIDDLTYSDADITEGPVSFAPTAPTASEYVAQVGQWAVINYQIRPWRNDWYRAEITSVVLQ